MKKNNKLDLYLPIALIVIFSLFLLVERIYTNSGINLFGNSKDNLTMLSDEEWKEYNENKNTSYNEKSLIIYNHYLDYSISTKNNIKYVLDTMSVKTYVKDVTEISENDNISNYDTIIICVQNLDEINYSPYQLQSYVSNGGGLLFAVDILECNVLEEYFGLLGVDGIMGSEGVDSLIFDDNFLINSKGKNYDKDIISVNVLNFELNENANIHVSSNDENDVPLVWDLKYGNGFVAVANNSLLTGKNSRGLIAAMYSSIHEVFAYPVINSAVYFIDDFPSPIPNGYDDLVLKEYGYTIKDFYFNIWWPAMKEISEKKGVKFSSYLIQTYEDDVDGPFNNFHFREESQYYINELLSTGGEMGIHGYNHQPLVANNFYYGEGVVYNRWPSSDKALESIESVLAYTKELTRNDNVISYVPPSNIISEELYLKMQEEIPEIKIYASLYIGDGSALDQEFDVLENGTVNVPRLYSNMEISNASDYMLINELSYHFVVSHFMHPDDILDVDRRSEEGFEYMNKKYNELIDFANNTKIRNTTISEAAGAIQRYQITSVNRDYNNNKLTLEVSGIFDEVHYILKTNGKTITSTKGCEYEKIAENYYLLTIDKSLVEVEME